MAPSAGARWKCHTESDGQMHEVREVTHLRRQRPAAAGDPAEDVASVALLDQPLRRIVAQALNDSYGLLVLAGLGVSVGHVQAVTAPACCRCVEHAPADALGHGEYLIRVPGDSGVLGGDHGDG